MAHATKASVVYGVPDNMMNYYEATATTNGCHDIAYYFTVDNFGTISYLCGSSTTSTIVYSNASNINSNFNYGTVFYKGHSLWLQPYQSPNPYGHDMYYMYPDNSNATADMIYDEMIGSYTGNGNIHFVFLWTCGMANEQGGISGTDIYGMSPAFMHTANLAVDYYPNSDGSGKCFIGFQYMSKDWTDSTGYQSYNYQNWAGGFYYNLVVLHRTVAESLNQASLSYLGMSFTYPNDTLYWGYQYYYNGQWYNCKMRIFGDPNIYVY
jgi:hypothetical protein